MRAQRTNTNIRSAYPYQDEDIPVDCFEFFLKGMRDYNINEEDLQTWRIDCKQCIQPDSSLIALAWSMLKTLLYYLVTASCLSMIANLYC